MQNLCIHAYTHLGRRSPRLWKNSQRDQWHTNKKLINTGSRANRKAQIPIQEEPERLRSHEYKAEYITEVEMMNAHFTHPPHPHPRALPSMIPCPTAHPRTTGKQLFYFNISIRSLNLVDIQQLWLLDKKFSFSCGLKKGGIVIMSFIISVYKYKVRGGTSQNIKKTPWVSLTKLTWFVPGISISV